MTAASRWRVFPTQETISDKLAKKLNIDPVIAQILLNRNIRSFEQAKRFVDPEYPHKKETLDISQLSKACEIIESIRDRKGRIILFGDYDVDGMTSVSIMLSFLKELGFHVDFHIPHRFTEGYGLKQSFLDYIIKQKYDLLITLDCGISNTKEIQYLKSQSQIQVIICDHHSIPEPVPAADAILNPKFFDLSHPLYYLCTAGIVYKFIEFYAESRSCDIDVQRHLDLVSLGTVADVAPLLNENRALTQKGLPLLSARSRKGIFHLLAVAGFDKPHVTVRDIGFTIAPRLNASGRLSHAKMGVELLMSQEESLSLDLAQTLQQLNIRRQNIGAALLSEAEEKILEVPDFETRKAIVLAQEGWHSGVIGITAAQLVRKYSKPAVLISINGKMGRASARTSGEINIYELLNNCAHFFVEFGGHKEAAGFSIETSKIPEFIDYFNQLCTDCISDALSAHVIDIDCKLAPHQITAEFYRQLTMLEPFGSGNPIPTFYTNQLSPVDFKRVGNNSAHLKVVFSDPQSYAVFDGIGFGLGHKIELLYNQSVEIIFSLDENHWNGKKSIQLHIIDIR